MALDDFRFAPPIFEVKSNDVFSVTMFVFGIVVIEVWDTELPVWGFVLSLLICMLSYRYTQLQCSSRAVRVFGELLQASGDIYDDSTHSDIDGCHGKNNGRATFGACMIVSYPGAELDLSNATTIK